MTLASTDRTQERSSREVLEQALRDAGAAIRGQEVRCPFHDDKHASGGIYRSDDGAWRFKCHGASCGFCGDVFDVRVRATGKPIGEVLGGSETAAPQRRTRPPRVFATVDELAASFNLPIEGTFKYTDPTTGEIDLAVMRLRKHDGGKTFRQGCRCGDGFAAQAPAKPWPIYNRTRLSAAAEVVVVEGEKCVHALAGLGIVATTSPCGAGKAGYADWSPLAGKRVYLWADHDDGGRKHMESVASILETSEPPCRVFWIEPDELGLEPKGDVADFIAAMDEATAEQKRTAVLEVLRTAHPVGCVQELEALLEDTIAGKREAIAWPWKRLGELSRALLPATVTLVCGDPGAAKSFMLLEAALFWHSQGRKVALFELEEDRAYHLHRALALQAGNGDLLDPDWIQANPDEVREAYALHADFLDGFGKRIYEAPDDEITAD